MIRNIAIAATLGIITLLSSCDGKPALASNDNCLLDADVCGALSELDDENYNFIDPGFNVQDVLDDGLAFLSVGNKFASLAYDASRNDASLVIGAAGDFIERIAVVYDDYFLEFDTPGNNTLAFKQWQNLPPVPQQLPAGIPIEIAYSTVNRRDIPDSSSLLLGLGAIVVGLGIKGAKKS